MASPVSLWSTGSLPQPEPDCQKEPSFWGLCARLYTKLTAHTLCLYLNRLLGNPDWLQIKGLAFPQSLAG
jgi:hypothetical protein